MVVNKVIEHKFHKLSSNLSCVLLPFTVIQNHQQNNKIDHIFSLSMKQMRRASQEFWNGMWEGIFRQNCAEHPCLKPESPEKPPKV